MNAPDTIYIPVDESRFSWRSTREKESDIPYGRKLTRYQIETLAFGDDGIETDLLIPNLWDLCQRQRVELAKLNKAVEAQKAEIGLLKSENESLAESNLCIRRYEAEIARLRNAALRYGSHLWDCDRIIEGTDCTCGFTAALKGE